MRVAVVYLAREAVAVGPFLAAYKKHAPGIKCDLIWLRKGDGGPFAPMVEQTTERIIHINDEGQSLCAFSKALRIIAGDYDFICYLNSWSKPRVEGWLSMLVDAANYPRSGLCGATASCESFSSNQLNPVKRALRKFLFPPFPNPHIRTTGFCAKSGVLLVIWPKRPYGYKSLEHMHEAGRWSISRRAEAMGLQNWVVGTDDKMLHVSGCWTPHYFRNHDADKLLISDNQTAEYAIASKAEKGWLEHKAWGREWHSENPMLKRIKCVNE